MAPYPRGGNMGTIVDAGAPMPSSVLFCENLTISVHLDEYFLFAFLNRALLYGIFSIPFFKPSLGQVCHFPIYTIQLYIMLLYKRQVVVLSSF